LCLALNHIYMTFNSNHICDKLCPKSHIYVAKVVCDTLCTKSHINVDKVTKCHIYMSPRLLKDMFVSSSVVGSYLWCDIMPVSISQRLVQVIVHFSTTCPSDSRRAICATLAYLESFSVAPRLRLLQCFEIMRLPSDTFARRRLTVTSVMRFKFHYKSPKVLCIHFQKVFGIY